MRKCWLPILIGAVAVAIPVAPLFLESTSDAPAASQENTRRTGARQAPGSLQQTDKHGDVWNLSRASGPSLFGFRKPGTPITVATKVRRLQARQMSIQLVLRGRGGETYRPMVRKGRSTLPAPRLRIVDKRGGLLAEGQLKYG